MEIELKDPLYQAALPILNIIESHGHEAYFVGGCVRDTLLGKDIHDIDIASSATPDEIQQIFKHTIDVGKQHGTIIALHQGTPYEITTFRTEGTYSDCRRPDSVAFVRNLQEDTLRRDFTINALAISPTGQLMDYHNGVSDLESRCIRAVGVPVERFSEDALRMLRALRFSSQLGFTIEPSTMAAIRQLAPLLDHISVERMRVEVSKFLQGDFVVEALPLLERTGLTLYFPLFEENLNYVPLVAVIDYLQRTFKALIDQNVERDERLCWAILLKGLNVVEEGRIGYFLRKWTHSNQFSQDVQDILKLMKHYDYQDINVWTVYRYSPIVLQLASNWQKIRPFDYQPDTLKMKENLPIKNRKALCINGKQIMNLLNMEKGSSKVGEIISKIEYAVVVGTLENDLESVKRYISILT